MSDSIKHVFDTIHVYQKDSYELVEKVNSFYDSAWNKLTIVGTVAFAIVGIALPLIIQWYQKRTLKLSEALLKESLKESIKEEKEKVIEEINKLLEDKFMIYEDKIEKMEAASNAKAWHLQGNGSIQKREFADALSDYVIACSNYLITDNYINLQGLLESIYTKCLPELSFEEVQDLIISKNANLEKLIDDIDSKDNTGSLLKSTRDIRLKLKKLPQTKKERLQLLATK